MRVVVTRAAHQAEELAMPLRRMGAEVISLPLIGIAAPLDGGPLRRSAADVNGYDWLVFTSANAVSAFAGQLEIAPQDIACRVAVVGSATRAAAEELGFRVALTPDTFTAEALAAALGSEQVAGMRILNPAAAVTRDVVPAELGKRGAMVEVVEAYRNILPPEAETAAREIFQPPYPDWVVFASPSAVDSLVTIIPARSLDAVKIASIGPVTSLAIQAHGLRVATEADPHTLAGLVARLAERLMESSMPYNATGTSTQ